MTRIWKLIAAFAMLQALAAVPAAAQTPPDGDLMALRFYIGEGNEQAVQSEIRRLQLQYPDWTPSEDLNEVSRDVPAEAIDEIYGLIATGDFDGARSLIDKTRQAYPAWSPTEELLQTLVIAEAQSRFTQAVDAGEANDAIRVARSNSALLRCERVNNAWLLAEQYQSVGDNESALAVYRSVLRSCDTSEVLIATLEKSAAIADAAALTALADLARETSPETAEQLTVVENRLQAGASSVPLKTPTDPTSQSAPDDLESDPTLAMMTSPRPNPRPKTLDTRPAISQPAPPRTSTARSSSGGSTPRPTGGGSAAAPNLSRAAQAAARGDWQGCLALTANAQSGAILSQRGWCALNADRPMEALNDFRKATAIGSTAQSRTDSAYGMALAMLRLGMIDQAAEVAANTHLDRKQRVEIESQILDKRGVYAYNRGDYGRAIAYFDELERLTGRMHRDLSLLRGYAYLNSGNRPAAVAEFRRAHDQMATPASRRALSEAMQ